MKINTKAKITTMLMAVVMAITLIVTLPIEAIAQSYEAVTDTSLTESPNFTQVVMDETSQLQLDYGVYGNITVNDVEELQSAVNNASEDSTISLSSSFIFESATITMSDVNIIIDGGNMSWSTGSIKVLGDKAGSLTIQNMKMNDASASEKLLTNEATNGKLILKNMEFYGSNYGAIDISTSADAYTIISETHIHNNEAYNAATAIWLGSTSNVEINNSTIEENTGTGGGSEGGGALSARSYKGSLVINNSVFRSNINKSTFNGIVGGGGGAISILYFYGSIKINESIFQNNQTNGGDTIAVSYDGGAIYIYDGRDGASITIDKTTFDSNIAYDDGGAMMIQGTANPGLTTIITNSTFYNNKAYGLDEANDAGGAIHFLKNGGSAKMVNSVISCTFVKNQGGNDSSTTEQRGGAIALSGFGLFSTASVTRNNCLFIGNIVYNNGQEDTSSKYKDISNYTTVQAGTINVVNVDSGDSILYTIEDILDINNILCENQSNKRAGINDEIVKTIPFRPESIADNTYTGSATILINGVSIPIQAEDQRGVSRYRDQGAVDLSWIKYNANGGSFELLDLPSYDGTKYYERNAESGHITEYFTIGSINDNTKIIDSAKLNASREGYSFLGWSTNKDDESPDTNYSTGSAIQYVQENFVLYAIWSENTEIVPITIQVEYYKDSLIGQPISTEQVQVSDFDLIPSEALVDGLGLDWMNKYKPTTGYESGELENPIPLILDGDIVIKVIYLPEREGGTSGSGSEPEPETYTYMVTYDGNGADRGTVPEIEYYAENTLVSVLGNTGNLIKSGHIFVGWALNSLGTGPIYQANDTHQIQSDIILYACWIDESIPNGYTLTYDDYGGNGDGPSPVSNLHVQSGYALNSNTIPTHDAVNGVAVVFIGWAANCDQKIYAKTDTDPDTITSINITGDNITVYAVWGYDTNSNGKPDVLEEKYNLMIQAEIGGTVEGAGGIYFSGDVVRISAIPDSGYSFNKWTSNNGGIFADNSNQNTIFTMPDRHVVITAKFSSNSEDKESNVSDYTVTYHANGGSGGYKVSGLSLDSLYTVLNTAKTGISWNNRTFICWNTEKDGSGIAYASGDKLTLKRNITLYAQWSSNTSLVGDLLETSDHIVYLNGYPDNSVGADKNITRAEVSAIFYRLLNTQGTAARGQFSDVADGAWYAQAVNYLTSINIIQGYTDGTFKPDKAISRAEFAAIAARFDSLVDFDSNAFGDVPKSHWAIDAINSACSKGWINGYPDGTFRPENNITRAEVVTIVNKMLERAIDDLALAELENPYRDISSGHWAYAAIIEASSVHKYVRDIHGNETWLSW